MLSLEGVPRLSERTGYMSVIERVKTPLRQNGMSAPSRNYCGAGCLYVQHIAMLPVVIRLRGVLTRLSNSANATLFCKIFSLVPFQLRMANHAR